MPNAASVPIPPWYVENSNPEPLGSNSVKKMSVAPPDFGCDAPGVTGKSLESVSPVTNASPAESTAMDLANWLPEPAKYVE